MKLAPMRYKNFTWPYNPRIYSIDYARNMAENKAPFGLYYLQDLGRTRRVMRGEGEFVGPQAYAQFGALANTFYDKGPGLLVHPLWQIANAYFVQLRLEQEPRPDYVRYSFAFWEASEGYSATVFELTSGTARPESTAGGAIQNTPVLIQVVSGDTLWAIAKRYGLTIQELIALNPQIRNPNRIYPGEEVRVG